MNLPTILDLNKRLLKGLKEVVPDKEAIKALTMEELDETSEKAAKVLIKLVPFLLIYSSYTNNVPTALGNLKRLQKDSRFMTFCTAAQLKGGQTLNSFLLMPVQRIPRYRLLMAEELAHTTMWHCDYEACYIALEKIKVRPLSCPFLVVPAACVVSV